MLLQVAIGPVFFFILNLALQRTILDGLFAVLAVTIVDYLFIGLALLGVGKLLEKKKIKKTLAVISSIVLVIFGALMMSAIGALTSDNISQANNVSDYTTSFLSAFLLTISSPLTIVFWTSLFASKAIENNFNKNELLIFGISAGFATLFFLGLTIILLSIFKTAIPVTAAKTGNVIVGFVLIVYGIRSLFKVFFRNA